MLSSDIQTAQPHQTNDFVEGITNWWKTCPLFTRCVLFLSSFISILTLFSKIDQYLINVPEKTIGSFQITRLIFCPFTFETIAELLFGLLAYLPQCAKQEKTNGTLKTAIDFFIKNLEINILFLIICYILSFIHDYFLTISSYGLWGIFFANLLEDTLNFPDRNVLFLSLPFQIASKYYPLALFVIFTIISEALRLDLIAGALIGIIHFRVLNRYYFELLDDRKVSAWETSSVITWLRTFSYYVPVGNQPGALMDSYEHPNPSPNTGTNQGFTVYSQPRKDSGQDVEDLANDMEKP